MADLKNEVWKSLKSHDYEISNYGNVRRLSSTKNLNYSISNSGYKVFHLYKKSIRTHFYAHILVAEFFIDKVEGKDIVNHRDGVKMNCFQDNLEWSTYSENNIHALENKLKIPSKGEQKAHSKLTDENVRFIRKTIGRLTNDFVAEKFSVSRGVISNVRTNKTWKHVV